MYFTFILSTSNGNYFHCKNIEYVVKNTTSQVYCCQEGINNMKCMPQFIIAGTQKSGTTALSGINITTVIH